MLKNSLSNTQFEMPGAVGGHGECHGDIGVPGRLHGYLPPDVLAPVTSPPVTEKAWSRSSPTFLAVGAECRVPAGIAQGRPVVLMRCRHHSRACRHIDGSGHGLDVLLDGLEWGEPPVNGVCRWCYELTASPTTGEVPVGVLSGLTWHTAIALSQNRRCALSFLLPRSLESAPRQRAFSCRATTQRWRVRQPVNTKYCAGRQSGRTHFSAQLPQSRCDQRHLG